MGLVLLTEMMGCRWGHQVMAVQVVIVVTLLMSPSEGDVHTDAYPPWMPTWGSAGCHINRGFRLPPGEPCGCKAQLLPKC